jgi:hypothetical protein
MAIVLNENELLLTTKTKDGRRTFILNQEIGCNLFLENDQNSLLCWNENTKKGNHKNDLFDDLFLVSSDAIYYLNSSQICKSLRSRNESLLKTPTLVSDYSFVAYLVNGYVHET